MILGVVQARMSSSRLPGKVAADVCGRPMLALQLSRLARSQRIDRLVVATSMEPGDDAVAQIAGGAGVGVHRGPLADVLARFAGAAEAFGPADHIVRLTADCPLADPAIIDACIALHLRLGADYTSNAIARTYADGLDVEVMTAATLAAAAAEASDPLDREHVTRFIYRRPVRFVMGALTQEIDQSAMRWTVDTADDLAMVRAVVAGLPEGFTRADVLAFLRAHPDIASLNGALGRDAAGQGHAGSSARKSASDQSGAPPRRARSTPVA